jgi:hypothetical protein
VKLSTISHEFVDYVPAELDESILYISTKYKTASHLCACGCGFKVATPIRPAQWHLLFDGESVSLFPSIGSHQFPCRSHYFIRRGRIHWERPWTQERAERGWHSDGEDLASYYDRSLGDDRSESAVAAPGAPAGVLHRLRRLIRAGRRPKSMS